MTTTPLVCDFMGWQLHSPLVLASGIIGTSAGLLARAAWAGAGMVTAKSCGPTPRAGHPNPVALDWGGGLINAIGLTNPGAEHEAVLLAESKRRLAPLGAPLIASIFAGTVEEFGQVAAIVAQAQPDLIEVNISCPNVGDEFGTPFAGTPESAAAVTAAVVAALRRSPHPSPLPQGEGARLAASAPPLPLGEGWGEGAPPLPLGEGWGEGAPRLPLGEGWDEGASRLPLGEGWGEGAPPLPLGEGWGEGRPFVTIKLAPNVPDIARIARAAVEAGADAITAVNTMPGMVIDAASGRPVLSNRVGGISGPALKPIALRAVYEIAQAAPGVSIIGTGGVSTGQDAAEMLMAGATVVGVGSAVWYRGVEVFGQINAELAAFMAQHGYPTVASLRRVSIQRG
jgi:dihydroorotate dehydrogenase